ncbi:MAG TPA: heme-degrading domain-containing protein [Herpetosiphonaceae bacterium]|nr:heme-degrading domain-containing protein [Herpetosiphonaceae bacterium]
MTTDHDLSRIQLQEERLQFERFDAATAWDLATRLKATAEERGLAVTIDIQLHGRPLFFYSLPGSGPDTVDWVRRKRNVVLRYHRSSYAIGLQLEKDGTTLTEQLGLDLRDYAPHGGCFPILLRGTGCVGTITVSGLPQRVDHELIIEALAGMLGLDYAGLALDADAA